MSNSSSLHGTLLVVANKGVLIMGNPGVGKSELALGLIDRGHHFIADDLVDIKREENFIFARAPLHYRGHLHLHHVGLIDIAKVYGKRRVKEQHHLDLIIRLSPKDEFLEIIDPFSPIQQQRDVLGVSIPEILLVSNYQNLALVVEVVVKNFEIKETHSSLAPVIRGEG